MAQTAAVTGTRAAIYCRISEDRKADERGVKRQLADCHKLARERGWTVTEELVDNDVSAYQGRLRPAYRELLDAVRTGAVEAVIAWHPDRLYRHPRDLEDFVGTVEGAGAAVATVSAGELDLSTPSGRMVARMLGAASRYEGEHKAERQKRKAREIAETGRPGGGGDRPFGYEDDRVTVRTSEAKVLREGVGYVLAGGSLRSLVARWNDAGIRTTRGNPWRSHTLRRLLLSPRIAGLREHRGVIVGPATWEGIIAPSEHEAIVAVLTDPARTKNAGRTARAYLLTGGVLHCASCGAAMVARPNDRGARRYACLKDFGGCNGTFILAEPVDDVIRDAVFVALDGDGLTRALAAKGPDTTDAEMELAKIHAKIDEIAGAYSDGALTLEAYSAATRKLEDRRDDLRRAAAAATSSRALRGVPSGIDALKAWWTDADLVQRREVVGAIVQSVTVGPALRGRNVFDPSRLKIRWKV
jgi:DNA invertase Pin-like site-specific DNA recombinase